MFPSRPIVKTLSKVQRSLLAPLSFTQTEFARDQRPNTPPSGLGGCWPLIHFAQTVDGCSSSVFPALATCWRDKFSYRRTIARAEWELGNFANKTPHWKLQTPQSKSGPRPSRLSFCWEWWSSHAPGLFWEFNQVLAAVSTQGGGAVLQRFSAPAPWRPFQTKTYRLVCEHNLPPP